MMPQMLIFIAAFVIALIIWAAISKGGKMTAAEEEIILLELLERYQGGLSDEDKQRLADLRANK